MLHPHILNSNPKFIDMYNYVQGYEKWFYMTKESERHYLILDKDDPIYTVKSKKFIEIVMFLAVVARPRF